MLLWGRHASHASPPSYHTIVTPLVREMRNYYVFFNLVILFYREKSRSIKLI